MFNIDPKAMLLIIIASAIFTSGYMVNDYRRDSIELAAKKATDNEAEKNRQREADIASAVEVRLAGLRVQERVIDRGVIKEITKNGEIYNRDCISESGRLLINQLARPQTASQPTPALPN